MTSDFGTDIFGDGESPAGGDATERQAGTTQTKAAEVSISRRSQPARTEETSDVSFGAPAPASRKTTPKEEDSGSAPAPASRKATPKKEGSGSAPTAPEEPKEAPQPAEATKRDRDDERQSEASTGRRRQSRRPERGDSQRRRDDRAGRDRPAQRTRGEQPRSDATEASDSGSPARDDRPRGRSRSRPRTGQPNVAVFLDVAALRDQARDLGSEVSYVRLLRGLANQRPVFRAVAYVPGEQETLKSTLSAHDIEVEHCDEGAVDVAIAVDALALAPKVDCVVLASGSSSLAPLARSLRNRGLRVESASFLADPAWEAPHHQQLGKGCLFVP